MIRKFLISLIFVAVLSAPSLAVADVAGKAIESTHARFRNTYENVNVPGNGRTGFWGGSLLYDFGNWFAIGPAAYGAAAGQLGGFITLGMAAEVKARLTDYLEFNSGLFVGGGGGRGGYLLAGGGLMMRYHAGLELVSDWGNIGAGYSYVDFPNGSIHSGQPYFSYDYEFSTLMTPSWLDRPQQQEDGYSSRSRLNEQEFSVVFKTYDVPSGVMQDNGTIPQYKYINLLGVGWNHYLNDNLFIHFESEGAMGGQSNGYMQILGGGGLRFQVLDGTWIKLMGSMGVAGGGKVATGGGFMLDAEGGIQQKLSDHLYAEATAGYTKAPGADFRAITYAAKLGYHFYTPKTDREVYLSDLGGFDFDHMRFRITHQTYFKDAPNWRSSYKNLNVDLLGFQIDYFLNKYFYLSGQGIAAYKGKAGSYMIGLVGVGTHIPLVGPVFAEVDGLGGAAGGGGLGVGGGLVWQADAGLGWQLNNRLSVLASYGQLEAPRGTLRAHVLTVSLGYNFTLFTR